MVLRGSEEYIIGRVWLGIVTHEYAEGSLGMLCKVRNSGPSCSKRRYLNELVKGHFVNCFSGLNIQYSDIFC